MKTLTNPRSLSTLTCFTLLTGTLLAACSSSATQPGAQPAAGADAGSKAAEPLKITMMTALNKPEPPKADNPMIKKVEELTNTKLTINWVPASTYADKLTASIASSDLPNLLVVLSASLRNPVISNAVSSGVFWDLTPYLNDYPNLKTMNPIVANNIKFNGNIYGISRDRDLSRNAIIIRKDWLDTLGLKEPKTLDELYNVAKAFTESDPDKNGKKDTYGFTDWKSITTFSNVLVWMGGPNGWSEENGKLSADYVAPEYLEAMKYMRRLYQEQLVNKDFLLVDKVQMQDNFAKGKAGLYIGAADDIEKMQDNLIQLSPNAKVSFTNRINGPKGVRSVGGSGHEGIVMVPKTSVKTEADLKNMLKFLDWTAGKEGVNILKWGVEGVQYKLENGKAQVIDSNKYIDEWESYGASLMTLRTYGIPIMTTDPTTERTEFMRADSSAIAVSNPSQALESKTNAEVGGSIKQKIEDVRNQFILGAADETAWKAAVESWRKDGGDKITEEYNAQYSAAKK
ncbi:extracellular solute-binding protein [Paenibacillus agricola]|uniref:Extracellular solute-binding protein n=1 Tax=Paenibacillus agricola TaxID=2716264 RepID=A0ABX0JA70_9BACL|nr:extracellular solute-binding protein [Paenibacillus agricola]NHN31767.1 extracellular solute-binding protein [Paenibacillus agricola]